MQGKILRYIRKALNLSLGELAEKLNVALTTVYRWENDRQGMSTENMRRLQAILNYTDEDLLEIEELLRSEQHSRLVVKLRKQANI